MNTEGGHVILGVSDEGRHVPVDIEKNRAIIEQKIRSTISPDPLSFRLVDFIATKFKGKDVLQIPVVKSREIYFYKGGVVVRHHGSNKVLKDKTEIMRYLSREIDEERYWGTFIHRLQKLEEDAKVLRETVLSMRSGNVPTGPVFRLECSWLETIFPFIRSKLEEERVVEDYLTVISLVNSINDGVNAILTNFPIFFLQTPNHVGRLRIQESLDTLILYFDESHFGGFLKMHFQQAQNYEGVDSEPAGSKKGQNTNRVY